MKVFENLLMALAIHRNSGRAMLKNIRQPALTKPSTTARSLRLAAERDPPRIERSQGARKLLDIAMAFVGRPRVLMLDEPTSGISTEEKFEFMSRVMAALALEKATVLIVEHDMDIIERFVSPGARVLAGPDHP